MYRKCVTEISEQHQKQVAESLLVLMQKIPFEEISVTQLCQAAGVTRRVFYHLFSNKTGALHALVDRRLLEIEGYDTGSGSELVRFFCYWKEQKAFLDALSANGMSGLLLERMIHRVLTEDFDVHYWLRSRGWTENSRDIIVFGLSGLMGLVYRWYYSDFSQPPEELAALVERILLPYQK